LFLNDIGVLFAWLDVELVLNIVFIDLNFNLPMTLSSDSNRLALFRLSFGFELFDSLVNICPFLFTFINHTLAIFIEIAGNILHVRFFMSIQVLGFGVGLLVLQRWLLHRSSSTTLCV
jgi:hypothetical protein